MESSATFVLGTAGHIDHGKTALVRALTGTETDRWKEEQERGITIDLGFARLPLTGGGTAAIVDVPGHEAFVRNMLAGASGLDAALLVVAADEGPMPQTLEHLAILDLMGVSRGVVALTKRDLVDEEWAELVESEIRSLVSGTSLAGAPVIATSAVGAPGVEDLKEAIERMADEVERRSADDLFRMPVDRSFTVRGTGTVVTGTVWSGRARVGDTVHLVPGHGATRVRRIHAFGEEVGEAVAGSRAALALTGVEKEEAPRGSTLTSAGWWEPTRLFTARIRTLDAAPPIEPDQRVRIHVGTAEVMARIHPFGSDVGSNMSPLFAEVRLEEPVLVRGRDRFVVRSYSPVTTIGGGVVLEPFPPPRRMRGTDPSSLAGAAGTSAERLSHALDVAGDQGMSRDLLAVWVGESMPAELGAADGATAVPVEVGDTLFARRAFEELCAKILAAIDEAHDSEPLAPGVALEQLRRLDGGSGQLIQGVLKQLASDGSVSVDSGWVSRTGYHPQPNPDQQTELDRIRTQLDEAGLQAPKLDELPEATHAPIEAYVSYMVRKGEATRLTGDLVISSSALERAAAAIREAFAGREGLGPADFREVLPVTRRHLVPILSHMDVIGVTVRRTDARDVPAQ